MGSSQPVSINQELPNSKEKGFSSIYRKRNVKQLRTTPDPSIRNLNDLINYTVTKNGQKRGVGYININAETDEQGKQVQVRTVKDFTFKQFYEMSLCLGRSLIKRNLFSVQSVRNMKLIGIYSKNCFQWLVCDWACIMTGLTTVPLYDTLGIDNLSFCLNQTQITTTFASLATIKTLLKLKNHGKLKTIISYEDVDHETIAKLKGINIDVVLYKDLIIEGSRLKQVIINTKIEGDSCYTFSYTSGTTGPPKGALISHKNALAFVTGIHFQSQLHFEPDDVYISYLPLPHVMQRTVFNSICYEGATFIVASGNILKLKDDCFAAKPTILLSVPRLFNKIVEGTKAKFEAETGIKKCLIDCGISSKLQSAKEKGTYSSSIYDSLIFQKVKDSFGGRIRSLGSGSAPLSAQTHMFMKAIMFCPLIEGYGSTESTAGYLFGKGIDTHYGVFAQIAETCQIKLCQIPEMKYTALDHNEDGVITPRGQLWVRGSNVFLGYYKQDDQTKETITKDGWLKTGDIVEINSETISIKLIDRKKNIFKLSQGEYVAPDKVENIYLRCPLVTEVFIHGQSTHHYAVAIVTPHKDNLLHFAETKGIRDTYDQLCKNAQVRALILTELNNIGKKAGLYGFEQAKNVYLDTQGFGPKNILTNTMKLIRFEARKYYKDIFDKLYQEGQMVIKS